jgi:type I restriction enzyme S subunit
MSDWSEVTLIDAIELQRGFDLPEKERLSGSFPIVASTSVVGFHNEARAKGPGVVIGRSGSIGGGQWIDEDYWPLNTTLWVKNFRGNDRRFVYFMLRNIDFARFNAGSGVPTLNRNHLASLVIQLPPLSEQQAIAEVLGALDDKIASNLGVTETIEKLIPLIFQSVTRESELRQLPEVAKLQKGISYRSVDLEPSNTAMVTLKSYDRNGGYKSNGLKPYIGKYKPEQVLLPGDMAVAQTDLTQGAEVVGRVIRIPRQDDFETLVASLDLVIVRPLAPEDETYLYGALLQEDFRDHCRSRTSGTTVLHLGSDALPQYLIPWASREVRKAFADEVRPLLEQHDAVTKESATLERLRDALLPELMSGRLRVKHAESMMENV